MDWDDFSSAIAYLPAQEQDVVRRAFDMGKSAHEGQKRQSGEPYFTHPIAVAVILAGMGADSDTIVAGLLHDTVEDTPLTLEQIEEKFGPVVATLIDGVTKLNEQDIAHHPSMNEQIETLRKMFTLMQKDVRIMVIKLADRLHNMQTLSFRSPEKQQSVAKETFDIYAKIADRLGMRDMQDALEGLCIQILEPELFPILAELRQDNKNQSGPTIDSIRGRLAGNFADVPVRIEFKDKHWNDLRIQYELGGSIATGVSGLNLAFVCKDIPGCYRVLGCLHQLWEREVNSFEDFINLPQINGYKAIHTTIIMEDGMRVLCKIRTEEMNEYASKGISMYSFKRGAANFLDLLPWTKNISPLSEDTKNKSDEFWENLKSDILDESIVIHGDHKTILVPQGATVLDAVFYLFGREGIYAKETLINGQHQPFYHALERSNTISVVLGDEPLVQLQWLQYVNTGIAAAIIRQELVKAPVETKQSVGKMLLDMAIKERGNIGLDELAHSVLKIQLLKHGLASMQELFQDIAEGKIDANQIAQNIFASREGKKKSRATVWTLKIDAPDSSRPQLERAIGSSPFNYLHFRKKKNGLHIVMRYLFTDEQARAMQALVGTILPHEQWSFAKTRTSQNLLTAIIILIILWGLDPVFARYLLTHDILPADLTIIRFITFFTASLLVYGTQMTFGRNKLRPLSPFQPTLVFSGISLFATAFFTYATLRSTSAAMYILFIVAGLFVSNLIHTYSKKLPMKVPLLSIGFILAGIAGLGYLEQVSASGLLNASAASFGFALYSELSRKYQQQSGFHARYPAFMFWVSAICLLLSFGMASFMDYTIPSPVALTEAVLFAIVFAVIPYLLYFEAIRRAETKLLDYSLPFVCFSTLAGEMILNRSVLPLLVAPIILIFIRLRRSES